MNTAANVCDYMASIAATSARSGVVIRLSSSMTPIHGVPGVFDYADSNK
jgi:hypothetical protein